jgi:iron complex transport system ATP-binding protein
MIKLHKLSVRFGKKKVLQNLSFEIEGHLTIVGANGSGKSTLAKCLAGLNSYSGTIEIQNINAAKIPAKERAKLLCYIPTKLEVYDAFITVEEFVLLGRFPHKESLFDYSQKDREIVRTMMEFLKITHLAKQQIGELSSGEQQLTLIAQALTQQSKIIIFDEPTANLDPKNSKIIAQHIKELQKSHTVILITHDLHLAAFIGSQILFLDDTTAALYGDEFFDDDVLERLYGVAFHALAVKYA